MKYFLGLEIDRNPIDNSIKINQHRFIERILTKFGLNNCNPSFVPTNPSIRLSAAMTSDIDDNNNMNNIPYREAVGSLIYLMIGSRLDIAYSVSNVSRYMEKPSIEHWNAVKQIFRYIKGSSDICIRYGNSSSSSTTSFANNAITAYCDADWQEIQICASLLQDI